MRPILRLTTAARPACRLRGAGGPARRLRGAGGPARRLTRVFAAIAGATSLFFLVLAPNADARWRWPVDGPVLTTFRYGADPFARGQRRGITVGAPVGTPVRSACDGDVSFRGSAGTAGRTVTVVCGAFTATYLHLETITARRGGRVRAGSRLGTVGRTGRPRLRATHLAFGVRRTGRRWAYVDPLTLLPGPSRPPPFTIGPAPRGRSPATSPRPGVKSPRPVVESPRSVVERPRSVVETPRSVVERPRPVGEGRRPTLFLPGPMPFSPSPRSRGPSGGPAGDGPAGAVPVVAWAGLAAVLAALVASPARALRRRRRQLRVAVKGVPPFSQ